MTNILAKIIANKCDGYFLSFILPKNFVLGNGVSPISPRKRIDSDSSIDSGDNSGNSRDADVIKGFEELLGIMDEFRHLEMHV